MKWWDQMPSSPLSMGVIKVELTSPLFNNSCPRPSPHHRNTKFLLPQFIYVVLSNKHHPYPRLTAHDLYFENWIVLKKFPFPTQPLYSPCPIIMLKYICFVWFYDFSQTPDKEINNLKSILYIQLSSLQINSYMTSEGIKKSMSE